jgi:tetratricopeptide (TPR) repeat protein
MKPGDVIAGRFELDRLAGSGGMGCVYRAHDRDSGADVAVKVLLGDAGRHRERFAREARVLEQLRHPSIVGHVAHGTTPEGELFLAMEWLDGEHLGARLSRGPLGVEETVALGRRLLSGLAAAHAIGVVHRDIKPANVYLPEGAAEQAKLLDFGIARFTGAVMTRTGSVLGTPGYMAPEQVRGEPHTDARADVFSMGCLLFECLSGEPAFRGEHAVAVLAKILIEDPPQLSSVRGGVPPALDALLAQAMSKIALARPADAAALDRALAAIDLAAARAASPAHPAVQALTEREQRRLYVVVTSPLCGVTEETSRPTVPDLVYLAAAETQQVTDQLDLRHRLKAEAAQFGAELELLGNGSAIATLAGIGSATDQAAAAARCALALRRAVPGAAVALATGTGFLAGRLPVGEVIERAVALLREATDTQGIRADEATAGLLDARFELGAGFELRGERDPAEATRTLLGRPSPCVGRDREIASLEALFHECADEELARAVLVTAPPGTGKSRLLREVLARLSRGERPAEVWIARGDPMSAGSPFGMLAQLVRRAADIRDGEPAAARLQKLRGRVRRHVPEKHRARVAEFLGELAGAPTDEPESAELRAARSDALRMGEQMHRAFIDLLAAECEARASGDPTPTPPQGGARNGGEQRAERSRGSPAGAVVVVLEDLHWGDVATVKAIDAALRDLRERRLLVFSLARPEIRAMFPRLWAGRAVTEMELGELPRRAGERLVRAMLGDAATPAVVDAVVTRAAGNAFYLEELIRAVAEGRGADLPDTVLAMVDARLDALDAEQRRVLRAAAVFGEVFWQGGLAELLGAGWTSGRLDAALAELVDEEVIERRHDARFPGQSEHAFRHGLVREAAYRRLTDADRTLGHRLAGSFLERAGETDASVLAEHFDRGGAPARAVPWYVRAGQDAIAGSSFERGIAVAERGVACGAAGQELGLLRLVQTEGHVMRFELAECARAGAEAMAILERGTGAWFGVVGAVSMASAQLGQRERAAALVQDLIGTEPRPGAIASCLMGYCWTMMTLSYSGLYPAAAGLLERAEALQRRLAPDDPAALAFVVQSRSWAAATEDDPWRRLTLARSAAAMREEVGYSGFAVRAHADLGSALHGVGAYDEAERVLRRAVDLAERTGTVHGTTFLELNLGATMLEQGRLDEAEALLRGVEEICRRTGEVYYAGVTAVQMARLLARRGDLMGALVEARKATGYPQARPLRAFAGAVAATILLAQGLAGEALAAARDAKRLFDAVGAVHEGDALIHLALAEALDAAGHRDEAASALRAAGERLLARAATIEDADLRASFLECVQDHARTISRSSPTGSAGAGVS